MPVGGLRQVQLALLLAECGASFVVAGGTARLLRGAARTPVDLDLVVRRTDAPRLITALQPRAVTAGRVRPEGSGPWRVLTSWTPVDVFAEDDLPAWHTVEIDGTRLQVADD